MLTLEQALPIVRSQAQFYWELEDFEPLHDRMELEDVIQEIVIKLLRFDALEKYDPTKSKPQTYLKTITKHCLIDLLSRTGKSVHSTPWPQVDAKPYIEVMIPGPDDTLRSVESSERVRQLSNIAHQAILSELTNVTFSTSDYLSLLLRDCPVNEISRCLGVTPSRIYQVNKRIRYICKQLVSNH